MKEFDLGKSLWLRFIRGAVAGAVSTGITVTVAGVNTFSDLRTFFSTLAVALVIGAVTGSLLAVDKFIRVE